MSWEVTNTDEHLCPCGAGSYRITTLSDDWGRTEERWEMICPTCATRFALHRYYYQDSGRTWPAFIWVKLEALRQVQDDQGDHAALKERILATARARYLDRWIQHFAHAKSRKEIWRILTNTGKCYPSLSTFYQATKGTVPRQYLTTRFTFENLTWILAQLDIQDAHIYGLLSEADRMRQTIEAQEVQLRKEGFR